jgi:FlaA1/EpsC-like NDP-sugar epimerase
MLNLSWLLESPRWQKRLLSIVIDFIGLFLISIVAIWLRLGELNLHVTGYMPAIALLPFLALPVFIRLGLYRAVVRYISYRFVFVVLGAVSLTFLLWSTAIFLFDLTFPRSALIIAWFMALLYISGTRLAVRWFFTMENGQESCGSHIVIFGAGASGRQLMHAMNTVSGRKIVAFVDDDPQLKNHKIGSVKVYSRQQLPELIERFQVSEVLLAIPSLSAVQRKAILNFLEPLPVKVSTLPPIDEIMNGRVSFSDVRELAIEDLLGRDAVPPQEGLLKQCIENKVVLVSGAGGSIGSELCRQVLRQKPKTLILFELSEFALYQIEKELCHFDIEVIAIIGSVLNTKKMTKVMQTYQVDTIYHAAAYKHVPLVEHNIEEGIKNNSFGTLNIARVAAENGVQNFVLISTDKAVRPTNFMGASKRLAELALQALQEEFAHTRFVMVRFGNVLGSSGSVIPLFRKQIAQGGPVTVTHKEITRYFMTIPEAASLVIQSGSMGTGGDVFVLDMGEPVKIADLALKVIHLSGLEEMDSEGNGGIEIQFTGLRPGEKLYEELLIGDNVDGTEHPRIMKAHEDYISYAELQVAFEELALAMEAYDYEAVSIQLSQLVSGFEHSSGIVDYLH